MFVPLGMFLVYFEPVAHYRLRGSVWPSSYCCSRTCIGRLCVSKTRELVSVGVGQAWLHKLCVVMRPCVCVGTRWAKCEEHTLICLSLHVCIGSIPLCPRGPRAADWYHLWRKTLATHCCFKAPANCPSGGSGFLPTDPIHHFSHLRLFSRLLSLLKLQTDCKLELCVSVCQ